MRHERCIGDVGVTDFQEGWRKIRVRLIFRRVEGKIPDCKIHTNSGFSEDEVSQLEAYMGRELMTLKNMAAGIHVMDAFLS